jgi:hypothetical protein
VDLENLAERQQVAELQVHAAAQKPRQRPMADLQRVLGPVACPKHASENRAYTHLQISLTYFRNPARLKQPADRKEHRGNPAPRSNCLHDRPSTDKQPDGQGSVAISEEVGGRRQGPGCRISLNDESGRRLGGGEAEQAGCTKRKIKL